MRTLVVSLSLTVLVFSSLRAHSQGATGSSLSGPNVIVDVGEPHAWTMEEAHYLLERNRLHDLGLTESDPSPLNPNDVVGDRVKALSTLLTGSVTYDQSISAKNSYAKQQYNQQLANYNQQLTTYNQQVAQYNQLLSTRVSLNNQQAEVAGRLQTAQAALAALKAQSNPAADPTAINKQQDVVNSLTGENATLTAKVSDVSTLMGSGPPAPPTVPTPPTLTAGTSAEESTATALGTNQDFENLVNKAGSLTGNPRLGAELQLDNYINLQYEMVAKQLSLLRDQAGPTNRVLIIELPQSIYVTSKFRLYPYIGGLWGNFLAQSWWMVDATLSCQKSSGYEPNGDDAGTSKAYRCPTYAETRELSNMLPAVKVEDVESARKQSQAARSVDPGATDAQNAQNAYHASVSDYSIHEFFQTSDTVASSIADTKIESKYLADWSQPKWLFTVNKQSGKATGAGNNDAFALDLIPRQSALNVVQSYTGTHLSGFAGLFGFLSGIGARARYERQSNDYSQFTQEENYGSAFGKGSSVFGWTFGPLPGTKQMNAGLRTTYAVLVVPKDTTIVRLQARGCGYRSRSVPQNPFDDDTKLQRAINEDCTATKTFFVEVSPTDDGIWVDSVDYQPVAAGQRQTVQIDGSFGPEVGLVVNGTPLQSVPSISQPGLTPAGYTVPPNAGDSSVQGVFENVQGQHLVASFTMPSTFVGTPVITLLTVGQSKILNNYCVWRSKTSDAGKGDSCEDRKTVTESIQASGTAAPTSPSPSPTPETVAKSGSFRVRANNADPMFTQPLTLSGVSPQFQPANAVAPPSEVVVLTVLGKGFVDDPNALLIISGHALVKDPPPAAGSTLAPGHFAFLNSGLLIATIRRQDYFPHWNINYVEANQNPIQSASITQDDSGPGRLASCTYGAPAATGQPSHFDLTGSYLSAGVAPTLLNTGTKTDMKATSSYVGPQAWGLDVVVPTPVPSMSAILVPSDSNDGTSITCTAAKTPAKPAAGAGAKTPAKPGAKPTAGAGAKPSATTDQAAADAAAAANKAAQSKVAADQAAADKAAAAQAAAQSKVAVDQLTADQAAASKAAAADKAAQDKLAADKAAAAAKSGTPPKPSPH